MASFNNSLQQQQSWVVQKAFDELYSNYVSNEAKKKSSSTVSKPEDERLISFNKQGTSAEENVKNLTNTSSELNRKVANQDNTSSRIAGKNFPKNPTWRNLNRPCTLSEFIVALCDKCGHLHYTSEKCPIFSVSRKNVVCKRVTSERDTCAPLDRACAVDENKPCEQQSSADTMDVYSVMSKMGCSRVGDSQSSVQKQDENRLVDQTKLKDGLNRHKKSVHFTVHAESPSKDNKPFTERKISPVRSESKDTNEMSSVDAQSFKVECHHKVTGEKAIQKTNDRKVNIEKKEKNHRRKWSWESLSSKQCQQIQHAFDETYTKYVENKAEAHDLSETNNPLGDELKTPNVTEIDKLMLNKHKELTKPEHNLKTKHSTSALFTVRKNVTFKRQYSLSEYINSLCDKCGYPHCLSDRCPNIGLSDKPLTYKTGSCSATCTGSHRNDLAPVSSACKSDVSSSQDDPAIEEPTCFKISGVSETKNSTTENGGMSEGQGEFLGEHRTKPEETQTDNKRQLWSRNTAQKVLAIGNVTTERQLENSDVHVNCSGKRQGKQNPNTDLATLGGRVSQRSLTKGTRKQDGGRKSHKSHVNKNKRMCNNSEASKKADCRKNSSRAKHVKSAKTKVVSQNQDCSATQHSVPKRKISGDLPDLLMDIKGINPAKKKLKPGERSNATNNLVSVTENNSADFSPSKPNQTDRASLDMLSILEHGSALVVDTIHQEEPLLTELFPETVRESGRQTRVSQGLDTLFQTGNHVGGIWQSIVTES